MKRKQHETAEAQRRRGAVIKDAFGFKALVEDLFRNGARGVLVAEHGTATMAPEFEQELSQHGICVGALSRRFQKRKGRA
jgi:hypothetical protein